MSRPKLNQIQNPRHEGREEIDMNSAIRWRIISLQAVMVVVLAGEAAFAIGLGTFTTGQIRAQLTAKQVYFPGGDQIEAAGWIETYTPYSASGLMLAPLVGPSPLVSE